MYLFRRILSNRPLLFYSAWLVLGLISVITCFSMYSLEEVFYEIEITETWSAFCIFGIWGLTTIFILPYYLFDIREHYALFLKILTLAVYPIVIIIFTIAMPADLKNFSQYLLCIVFIGMFLLPITIFTVCIENDSNPLLLNLFLIGGLAALFFLLWPLSFLSLLYVLFFLLLCLVLILYSLFLPIYTIFTMVSDTGFFEFLDKYLPDPPSSSSSSYDYKPTPSASKNTAKEDPYARYQEEREKNNHYYHYKTVVDNTISSPYSSPIAGKPCVDVDYVITFHYKTKSGNTTTRRVYGTLHSRPTYGAELSVREAEDTYGSYTKDFYE